MPVAQIGFLYLTRSLNGNVLSEKENNYLVKKNRVFNQKS